VKDLVASRAALRAPCVLVVAWVPGHCMPGFTRRKFGANVLEQGRLKEPELELGQRSARRVASQDSKNVLMPISANK